MTGAPVPAAAPAPRRRLTRRRKVAFAALAVATLLAGPVLVGELGARLLVWRRHGVPGKTYGLWQHDAELGAVHRANAYNTLTQTNNFAFRGREDVPVERPPGSLRVVCYGGSTTFCYNLPDGETWPERLQARLRAAPGHERDQVLNGGHVMWSLGHLLVRARRELPALRPDWVVLYSGINEEINLHYLELAGVDPARLLAEGRFGVVATNFDHCNWLLRSSVLARYAHDRLRQAQAEHRPPEATVDLSEERFLASWGWRNYEHLVRRMVDEVRAAGARLLYVVQVGVSDTPQLVRYLRYTRHGAALARSLGGPVCDLRERFAAHPERERLFYTTGVHLSAQGADVLAEGLAGALLATANR